MSWSDAPRTPHTLTAHGSNLFPRGQTCNTTFHIRYNEDQRDVVEGAEDTARYN